MKALTLWQPWASALALGWKRWETRPSWALRLRSMVGEDLAITAAAHSDWPKDRGRAAARLSGSVSQELWHHMRDVHGIDHPLAWTVQQPRGCVLAVARVGAVLPMVDRWPSSTPGSSAPCTPAVFVGEHYPWTWWDGHGDRWGPMERGHPLTDTELVWGDWSPGRVAVRLDNLRPLLEPVPCRGFQQVWTLPPLVEAQVNVHLALADARRARDEAKAR